MGFISNQLEGALNAGIAHKDLAAKLFNYCRDNKDSIGSEGYWQMFTMPNADLGELAKSIKYLPKKNGNYCVELADVNFYFKTESDAGPLLPPTIYVMKESLGSIGGGAKSSSSTSSSNSTINMLRQAGIDVDPTLAGLLAAAEADDDIDPEEHERRSAAARQAAANRKAAEARAQEKAEEIKNFPMPEPSELVFKLKECQLYIEQTNKTEKGKAAKIIREAWETRYQLLIEYGKIHCPEDPAFQPILSEYEEERRKIEEERLKKEEERKRKEEEAKKKAEADAKKKAKEAAKKKKAAEKKKSDDSN